MNDTRADKILGGVLIFAGVMMLSIIAYTSYDIFLGGGIRPDGVSAWVGFALMALFLVGYGIDYLTYAYQIFFRDKHIFTVDYEEINRRVDEERRARLSN